MAERIRIALFDSQEGRFLDAVRKVAQDRGNALSIHAIDGSSSTEIKSHELESGVWLTLQRIGPVEYLTVRKEEEGKEEDTLLVDAERQADSYIVYSHQTADWERPFRRKQKAGKTTQEESPR